MSVKFNTTKFSVDISQHMHPSITADKIMAAMAADDCLGYCVRCGYEQSQCEPDCRRRECEQCHSKSVYGAEELMLMIGFA